MPNLHDRLVVVDALEYSNWDREVFAEIRRGGVTCVHVTLAVWHGARETLDLIGEWHQRFREHADLIVHARTADDILAAKKAGRTAIVFGFQNASPFEDDLALVQVFHDLGIRIVQLTYNIANHVGSSCYEPHDGGLTRFGKFVVGEMNRVGMLVDLSHVGERTSLDAIACSTRPVTITHANPSSFHPHARNKSDEVIRALAAKGGVLGLAPYPHLTGGGEIPLRSWCEMARRTVELIGIEHVGIGSDASRKWSDEYLINYVRRGRWSFETNYGAGTREQQGWAPWPSWFQTPADFPKLTEGLLDVGFAESDVAAIVGGNWMRMFRDGFGPR